MPYAFQDVVSGFFSAATSIEQIDTISGVHKSVAKPSVHSLMLHACLFFNSILWAGLTF